MGWKFKPRIGDHQPYQLTDDGWCVINRKTGELIGEMEPMPHQWAAKKAKQLNEGEEPCSMEQ